MLIITIQVRYETESPSHSLTQSLSICVFRSYSIGKHNGAVRSFLLWILPTTFDFFSVSSLLSGFSSWLLFVCYCCWSLAIFREHTTHHIPTILLYALWMCVCGAKKTKSNIEMCNQVVGYTFFIWPYLSYIQINRSIESLRHVIRIWTPFWFAFFSTAFFSTFGVLFWGFYPGLFFPSPKQPTHTRTNIRYYTHTHTRTHSWLVRFWARFNRLSWKICHNNGFSIRWAIFLLSSRKGTKTEWLMIQSNGIRNSHREQEEKKNGPNRLSFSVLWFSFKEKAKNCPSPLFSAILLASAKFVCDCQSANIFKIDDLFAGIMGFCFFKRRSCSIFAREKNRKEIVVFSL